MSWRDRTIDRREFAELTGLTVAGVGLAGIAGCLGDGGDGSDGDDGGSGDGDGDGGAGGGGDDGGDGDGSTSSDGADREGGHLRVVAGQSPENLNPLAAEGIRASMYARNWMYSRLFRLDSELRPYPDLAAGFGTVDDEATEWVFELREDATFSYNDQQVLADDVVATFETIYDPDLEHVAYGELGPIESVEAVNDQTVQFDLESPFADFPHKLSRDIASVLPKDAIENHSDEGQPGHGGDLPTEDFGSGPFDLVEFEVGDHLTFEAADEYHMTGEDDTQLPYLDRVTVDIVPETTSQYNALDNREADVLPIAAPSQWDRVTNMDGVNTVEMDAGQAFPFVMDRTFEPFDDVRFVHAVKYAIDKEAILNSVGGGLGTVAEDTPVSPAHPYYADLDSEFGPEPKPDEARALLDEMGYAEEFELDWDLVVADYLPQMPQTAVIVQDQLQEVGINFDINEITWSTYLSEWLDHPFYVTSYGFNAHPDDLLYRVFHPDGDWSYKDHLHEVTDEAYTAIEAARAATDENERAEHYQRAQEVIHEEGGHVFPYFQSALAAHGDYLENYDPDPLQRSVPITEAWLTEQPNR